MTIIPRFVQAWSRLAWFLAIYAASILGLGVVAFALRLWLKAV